MVLKLNCFKTPANKTKYKIVFYVVLGELTFKENPNSSDVHDWMRHSVIGKS